MQDAFRAFSSRGPLSTEGLAFKCSYNTSVLTVESPEAQCFPKCGPQTSSGSSITWKLRNAHSPAPHQTTGIRKDGAGSASCSLKRLPGDPDAHSGLGTKTAADCQQALPYWVPPPPIPLPRLLTGNLHLRSPRSLSAGHASSFIFTMVLRGR